ncbi:hypothetical protein [Collimonas sp.]|jgi:hypothetical protein|uniref:hypothetical protein n=1 Tax=Collimonas sp. TaxID=1963772 RepID=UPI0037BFBE9E
MSLPFFSALPPAPEFSLPYPVSRCKPQACIDKVVTAEDGCDRSRLQVAVSVDARSRDIVAAIAVCVAIQIQTSLFIINDAESKRKQRTVFK